jgi:hypothetical protein
MPDASSQADQSLAPLPPAKPVLTPKRAMISGFIAFHLIAIMAASFPPTSLFLEATKEAIKPYMLWTGLWQTWAMFAPDPPSFNNYLDAEITYRSGHKSVWKFPVPIDYGYYRRYFMERYRKWGSDYVRTDANSVLWPDAARYVAWVNNDRNDPPDTVKLVRHWSRIPPIDSVRTAGPPHWDRYVYFVYAVKPGDLR